MFRLAIICLSRAHDTLRLNPNATVDQVQARYRELAKQYHPDHYTGGDDKFKEINAAYLEIMRALKPSMYDNERNSSFYSESSSSSSSSSSSYSSTNREYSKSYCGERTSADRGDPNRMTKDYNPTFQMYSFFDVAFILSCFALFFMSIGLEKSLIEDGYRQRRIKAREYFFTYVQAAPMFKPSNQKTSLPAKESESRPRDTREYSRLANTGLPLSEYTYLAETASANGMGALNTSSPSADVEELAA